MTSYRRARVIRENDRTTSHFSSIKNCIPFFHKGIDIIWSIIKLLWYWIERVVLVVILLGLTVGLAWWLSQVPSLHRDWEMQDAILPIVTFSGNTIEVQNIRNHTWTSDKEFVPGYYTDTFDLDEIERVYYSITPFSDKVGPAHTMLSFSFSGGKNIVISAELRKERGESFSALKGILNQYELQYVIASETDVIQLRTNHRKNQVYMYPIDTPKEKVQALFRSMMIRADKLNREPEFYNTLWNNCTTTILTHANALRIEKIVGGKYTLLPAHSDQIVYEAELIDTELTLEAARAYYRIDEVARSVSGEVDFSRAIRREIR